MPVSQRETGVIQVGAQPLEIHLEHRVVEVQLRFLVGKQGWSAKKALDMVGEGAEAQKHGIQPLGQLAEQVEHLGLAG